jgi:hypothetical protein
MIFGEQAQPLKIDIWGINRFGVTLSGFHQTAASMLKRVQAGPLGDQR